MKKASLIILFISIILTSCSKEETKSNQVTNNDLIGRWKVTNVTSENGKLSGVISGIPLNADFSAIGKDYTMVITFTDKKIASTGGFTLVAEVNFLTQKQTVEQNINNIPAVNGNWNVENNNLTTTQNGTTATIKIVSYSNSEIIFKYTMHEDLGTIESINLTNGKINGNLILKATKQ